MALRDGAAAGAVPPDGEAASLLRDALLARARARGITAIAAAAVGRGDPGAVRVALGVLDDGATAELANALETIEAAVPSATVRSLLRLWEAPAVPAPDAGGDASWIDAAAMDEDPFIRGCAELVRTTTEPTWQGGASMARSDRSMSRMELVLVLRRIPLFAALEPTELERVAAIAEERSYADGDVMEREGELGDELHVVLDGTVRVEREDGTTIAHRGAGHVVGEMSLITGSPRMASLVAEGDVRTVSIGRAEFEGMIRERPDIALAVMRELAERLTASAAGAAAPEPSPR
jgi:hypothetical protein